MGAGLLGAAESPLGVGTGGIDGAAAGGVAVGAAAGAGVGGLGEAALGAEGAAADGVVSALVGSLGVGDELQPAPSAPA